MHFPSFFLIQQIDWFLARNLSKQSLHLSNIVLFPPFFCTFLQMIGSAFCSRICVRVCCVCVCVCVCAVTQHRPTTRSRTARRTAPCCPARTRPRSRPIKWSHRLVASRSHLPCVAHAHTRTHIYRHIYHICLLFISFIHS